MNQNSAEKLLPMEKAEKYGIDKLTPAELLAIILRVGQPNMPITELTADLMRRNENKLKVLERRTREELMSLPGIGPVKAFQIEAVLEIMRRYNLEKLDDRLVFKLSGDIFRYMQPKAARLTTESIWILLLNRANALIECKTVSSGGTSATVFDLKSILRQILITPGVESIIMVHNHPSGNLRPSPQDDQITLQLKEGCRYIGIRLLDHIIVTQDSYYSYSDQGRMDNFS